MNILVLGGTGFIGSGLVEELVERGHGVAAMSVEEDAEVPEGVEYVQGDITDYDSMVDAFDGRDAVVNLVALSPLRKPEKGLSHEDIHLGGTENAVRAAEEKGVEDFIQMSALGADPDGPTAFLRAKGRAEEVVRESEHEWLIFRPSVVFGEGGEFVNYVDNLTAPYLSFLPGGGKTRFQPIYRGDLISIMADAIEEGVRNRVLELGGPDELSLADITQMLYSSRNESVAILPIPMFAVRIGLQLASRLGFPMGPDQYRSLKMDNVTNSNAASDYIPLEEMKPLREFLGSR